MKRLFQINNVKLIKEYTIILSIILSIVYTTIIVIDLHEQSILDREYGKLLIKQKDIQLQVSEQGE